MMHVQAVGLLPRAPDPDILVRSGSGYFAKDPDPIFLAQNWIYFFIVRSESSFPDTGLTAWINCNHPDTELKLSYRIVAIEPTKLVSKFINYQKHFFI